jgi:hypothetical protein
MPSKLVKIMGDKKPKKNSSGNSDAHKAKEANQAAKKEAARPKSIEKKKDGK